MQPRTGLGCRRGNRSRGAPGPSGGIAGMRGEQAQILASLCPFWSRPTPLPLRQLPAVRRAPQVPADQRHQLRQHLGHAPRRPSQGLGNLRGVQRRHGAQSRLEPLPAPVPCRLDDVGRDGRASRSSRSWRESLAISVAAWAARASSTRWRPASAARSWSLRSRLERSQDAASSGSRPPSGARASRPSWRAEKTLLAGTAFSRAPDLDLHGSAAGAGAEPRRLSDSVRREPARRAEACGLHAVHVDNGR